MRVVTKLVKMEFKAGAITRDGENLVLESHPDAVMKVKAYITPDDVTDVIKLCMNPQIIGYVLALPGISWRNRKKASQEGQGKK